MLSLLSFSRFGKVQTLQESNSQEQGNVNWSSLNHHLLLDELIIQLKVYFYRGLSRVLKDK